MGHKQNNNNNNKQTNEQKRQYDRLCPAVVQLATHIDFKNKSSAYRTVLCKIWRSIILASYSPLTKKRNYAWKASEKLTLSCELFCSTTRAIDTLQF